MSALRGQRVLVTGGAGLIGSHLTDLLVAAGADRILIFDNFSRGRPENLAGAMASGRVDIIEGDIRDRGLLSLSLEGVDLLFHLAAIRLTQCAEQPRLALEVMADGTFNVLEAAAGARVPKVVAASSASIYGMAEHFPTREDHHPYANATIYGAAKVFNEGLLASFRDMYGLDYLALRPFNVYGPRMDTQGAYTEVLIRWMDRIARGQAPIIFGDGRQTLDFVFVEDVARAFLLAGASAATGQAINVASGVETSLNELARTLLDAMDADLPVEHGPERALTAMPRRLADTGKARTLLGFEAQIGLAEGLRRLVRWWRQLPAPATAAAP